MKKALVLVVDDQEEILASLGGILTDEGYDVLLARDGQEALHIVQSDSPDVVFLDIWIPGIDGMQTLKAIKRVAPDCSVIMMSGHGTIETAVKAIKMGATDYLEKPLNLEDVLHLVEKSVSDSPSVSPAPPVNGLSAPELTGGSEPALGLRKAVEEAGAQRGWIWIHGEEGTGKEYVARLIHHTSGKNRDALIKARCTELTPANFDEVFIGREDSAGRRSPGKLAQAADGTLLLIRVDRLEESLRPRLAALMNDVLARRAKSGSVGGFRGRVVCTALCGPSVLAEEFGFPKELSDAMGEAVIRVPGLAERPEDIEPLVKAFLKEAAGEFDKKISGVSPDAMSRLMNYSWPGNVKELKILIEHVVMTAPGPEIKGDDLLIPGDIAALQSPQPTPALVHEESAKLKPITAMSEVFTLSTMSSRAEWPSLSNTFGAQKTLRGKVVMYGQGLHSGTKTGLTLSPLPRGGGVIFGHITSGGAVPALLNNVESTELSTCLRGDGSSARTIEHLMAVFHVYGLTNVLVKTSGEVPIMDGSAVEFCELIESAEIILQEDLIEKIRITETFELPLPPSSGKSMAVEPSDCFEIEYFLDYPPPIGSMRLNYRCVDPDDFKINIAPARTFGFVRDMRMLDEMGLAGGGRLSNVVLIDEEKVVNPPLRFEDEFVRHKILDIIGDFYLLGRPFQGKVTARQTGHTENIAMLTLINEKMKIL
jgi:UDP-3-O-acyl N-acetylglucosamine deacetylase